MDAKDLRIETALGERNDGSKYSQSGVALQSHRSKAYQDIGSNPLAKAEATVRPCAVIGPDRVVPPPASSETYLKKSSVDLWPSPDNLYSCSPEYPQKTQNNVNVTRNISPRQTFQENMPRIMVPPTYSAVKHADESNQNNVQDPNAALSKNTKQNVSLDAKYCDVPYTVNLLSNEHKTARETGMCVPSGNSPLTRTAPHGWPPGGLHAPRMYSAHDVYQYPQYPSCAGPRPSVVSVPRPHRPFQDETGYVYPDSYYQDASVRFKPYPSMKERYPQARYDYISNYPSPFHPPPPYVPHKYDIPNARPHPYPVYPHLKYLENRVPDPNIEGYQRPQQSVNYNMQYRNHPSYVPALGSTPSKVPCYPPDAAGKTSNKLPFDNNKAYVDYENAKAKYSMPDSFFVNEMARVHQVQKSVPIPNYASHVYPVQMQPYQRKDNIPMKTYEYMPHFRHFEHPVGFNPSVHHPPQFSPSTLAISPTDSTTSNDTQTHGTSQEDCGYVSQSSTTSARSVDSGISRLHNEYYRRYDYRYRPTIGNPQMLPKPDFNCNNSKENKKIDVRQFLSMWSEVDDESSSNNNTKEISAPKIADPNNHLRCHETENDQLYVLGLVNVPKEELAKYEHIQKVSKLPENIKGYNNIELLNQFEEVIELSNMNSSKPTNSKEFVPLKDRKNALRQIVEVLPRPVSPLDVEAKISQSVIHKEVGCNFEIRPCSPKMMNVEIATPAQNILDERTIEKVSNPLLNKAKSPLIMKMNENTICSKAQRKDKTHTGYGNPSCKMVGSPFTINNMEPPKTNYSLHDLETSSGVCLASLPRLDNEIELNFPEVNQQFINANKGDSNLLEKYSEGVSHNNLKMNNLCDKNKSKHDSYTYNNVHTNSGQELNKLNENRKAKVNYIVLEDESNINAIRTDSVIIENPENVRRNEENKEKISTYRTVTKGENSPVNLTSQKSFHEIESDTTNSPKHKMHECALDFSLSKPENGLPIISACDDEFVKNIALKHNSMCDTINELNVLNNDGDLIKDVDEPSKLSSEFTSNEPSSPSIIVKNKPSSLCERPIELKNTSSLASIHDNIVSMEPAKRSDEYLKENQESNFDNKTSLVDKATSTNVIVKHKLNKFKKFITDKILTSNVNHKLQCKIVQNTEQKLNITDMQNSNLSDDYEKNKKDLSDVCKLEKLHSASIVTNDNSTPYSHLKEEQNIDSLSNLKTTSNKEMAKNSTKMIMEPVQIEEGNIKINDTISTLISDQCQGLESKSEINHSKYYNDLISVDELLVDKTTVASIADNSLVHDDKNSADEIKITENSTDAKGSSLENYSFEPKSHNKTIDLSIKEQPNRPINDSEMLEPCSGIAKEAVSESKLFDSERCGVHDERNNRDSLDVVNGSAEVSESIVVEKVIDNVTLTDRKQINSTIGYSCKESETLEDTENNDTKQLNTIQNTGPLIDKHFSTDSGYRSNKSSFAENNDNIIEIPENVGEDSVFVENESKSVQITQENCTKSDKDDSDALQLVSDTPVLLDTSSDLVNIENTINFEQFNPNKKLDLSSSTLQSNDLYDSIDANMQILFQQPNEVTLLENQSVDIVNTHIKDTNCHLQPKNEKDNVALNTLPSDQKCHEVDSKQHVFDTPKQLNVKKEIEISFDIDMENKTTDPIEDDKMKKEDNINTNDHGVLYDSGGITHRKLDEPCVKSSKQDENDTEVHIQYCKYRGKTLNCPTIQKLITYTEGKIDSKNKDSVKYVESILKDSTSDNLPFLKIDDECEISSETTEQTEIKQPIHSLSEKLNHKNNTDVITESENITTIHIDKTVEKEIETKLNQSNEKLNISMNQKKYTDDHISYQTQSENISKIHIDKTIESEIANVHIDMPDVQNNLINTQVISCPDAENFEISKGGSFNDKEGNSDFEKLCIEKCGVENDQINTQDDSFFNQGSPIEINMNESTSPEEGKHSEFEKDCIDECDVHNDLVDTQDISFSYSDNSIITQITDNIFEKNDSILDIKYEDNNDKEVIKLDDKINSLPINRRQSLKRSFSDSALNSQVIHCTWPPKRNRVSELENFLPNNRRNSVNIEENVSFCILIDDNCLITEESDEKICIAELQEDYITEIHTGNGDDDNDSLKESYSSAHEIIHVDNEILECEEDNLIQESWVESIAGVETNFSVEVAENVVISAPSSPTGSTSENEHVESSIYGNATCSHTDKVKFLHGEGLSYKDALIVETLYRTPHMDIMNKTLLYGHQNVESDSNLSDTDQENILLEPDDWKPSPTHSPNYIDPTHASNYFRLETPENKENVFVKELSPLRRIDDYLDISSAENETDEHNTSPKYVVESAKTTQDGTVHSCESSLDNVVNYDSKDDSVNTTISTSCTTPSSSEVSSTTSEEKNSSILLKITNLNGSRVSQINEIDANNRPRCKFTEKKEYSTSNLNFPNRPLLTKAAQKYIPPIKESIRDLKVKITLPQQSLLKLKQLKLSQSESKIRKQHSVPRIAKKPKPNFDEVLKSIDELQIKRHKEKNRKIKTVIPKVVIKKNEYGSHYASTPKKEPFNPDLTGRKWQPWVFLEKNHFIDKMAIKSKTRAIYNHRKKTYVLAEKFKKYKSISSTKFIISQPKTSGQLKYTIRLKHNY